MQKNNIRSFRYSDEVKRVLESFNGNNMNDKFENFFIFCFKEIPNIEERLNLLNKEIEKKLIFLSCLDKEVYELEMMIKELEKAKKTFELISQQSKEIVKNYVS